MNAVSSPIVSSGLCLRTQWPWDEWNEWSTIVPPMRRMSSWPPRPMKSLIVEYAAVTRAVQKFAPRYLPSTLRWWMTLFRCRL